MLNKIPSQISFGTDQQSSYKFDDQLSIRTGNFKIAGFKIYLQDNIICGIAIIYLNIGIGRKIIFTDTYQNRKYNNQYEFDIASNDYIQVIFGHYDQKINQLGIITYSGKQEIFGIDQGKSFNYMFMGHTFTGCNGTFTLNSIQTLGFQVQQLPKDYIQQNLHPLLEIFYPSIENNHIQNIEQMNTRQLNLSEFTILNKSGRQDNNQKNQNELLESELIKQLEYQKFDYFNLPFKETQQQNTRFVSNNNQKKNQQGSATPDLQSVGVGIKIGIGLFKLITHH
ncbi:unnamed protein product [Paramecium primaurelia]|uniref:Jacalin-type lectin domain-containing protein n=1 Tax=Paramecium primaurelia TaxID=5886 RepID=A0A8S1LTK4_PARPR|nr:unnamed protein product [Paramecium primaurelia]